MKHTPFQPATPTDWEQQATRELRHQPLEVLNHHPSPELTLPPVVHGHRPAAVLPRRASGPWHVAHAYRHPDPVEAGQAIAEDLRYGLQLAWVCRATPGAPAGRGGVCWAGVDDLDHVLKPVRLATMPVVLEAGDAGPEVGAALRQVATRRGVEHTSLRGAIFSDPLGQLACTGSVNGTLDNRISMLFEFARKARVDTPSLRVVGVSAVPYHNAGATAVQELAYALATGVEILRRGAAAGHTINDLGQQMVFQMALGRNLLASCAKLRALRSCWAAVVARAGGGPKAQAMCLHASGSWYELASAEPWSNLLRGTVQAVAATMGAVDSLDLPGFDCARATDGAFARRLALNTQLLLRDESNLGRVSDPASTSSYIETLTTELAREAWQRVQVIEAQGGISKLLLTGDIQRNCAKALLHSQAEVAQLSRAIVGINRFAFLDVPAIPDAQQSKLNPASKPNSHAAATPKLCPPLVRRRLATEFEALRDRTRNHLEGHGIRPQVCVLALGTLREHKAHVAQARGLLESAGIELLDPTPPEGHPPEQAISKWQQSGASAAILCGSQEDLERHGSSLVTGLQSLPSRPRLIVCMGNKPTGAADWHPVIHTWLTPGNVLTQLAPLTQQLCQPTTEGAV